MKIPDYTKKINRLRHVKVLLQQALHHLKRKKRLSHVDLQRIEELKMFCNIAERQIKDYTIAQNSSAFIAWKKYRRKKRINI